MRVPEFYIVNEKGQEYSLMDLLNYGLLTNVTGLGNSYTSQYQQFGNTFIENLRQIQQSVINTTIKFKNYDNFNNFANFVLCAEKLKFLYKIPLENTNTKKIEYLKDILIQSISKGYEITDEEGVFSDIVFDCLGLWYQDKETVYTIAKTEQELQWDFRWDARFADYSSRSIIHTNDGHNEAGFTVEMCNYLINPGFYITKNGIILHKLIIPITLQKGEILMYSSKDKELYIKKKNVDGTFTNLFTQEYIDLNNENLFKIPKGTCEFTLVADNDIYDARLRIFNERGVV